ncbi:MAG TPA: response regulator transcription factor [Candidatus Scatomorpha merdigallinarum]|nr:response regulator transcription factor [Candidatus Scatomorpha merdigallinarum]
MIYCVEDDSAIRDIEVYALRSTGFEAEGLESGEELFAAIKKRVPELIILDVMLPGEDGLEILKRIRFNALTRSVPVIMATARGEEYDKITGLDSGADDYLVKPFGMMEMVSRVRAVLRRAGGGESERERQLVLGSLTLDPSSHTVSVNGESVALTLKEFELLRTMMAKPGVVFTRDRLLSEVWGTDYDGETRTVDVHIRTLRQKLGEAGSMIGTVRGVGYRMEAQP